MQGTDPWLWCQSAAGTQHSALTPAPCCYLSAIKRHFLEKQSQWKRSLTRLCFLQNNCGDTNYKGFVVTIAHPAHFSRGTSEEPTKKNQINYSTGNNPEDDRLHQLSNERAAFNLHDCNHQATGVIFLWEMKMFPVWLKRSKETDG